LPISLHYGSSNATMFFPLLMKTHETCKAFIRVCSKSPAHVSSNDVK
jgi:hypothetical protein